MARMRSPLTPEQREKRRAYYIEHRDELVKQNRLRYEKHRDEISAARRAQRAALRASDPEGYRAVETIRYQNYKEKIRKRVNARYAVHKDKIIARAWELHSIDPRFRMIQGSKERARSQGIPHTITKDDLVVPSFCPVLGIKLEVSRGSRGPGSPTIDRIIPELGYVPGNVIVVSWRANALKKDATIKELKMLARFYSRLGKGRT